MNTVLENLKAAKQNVSQLLVAVTLAAANPTPANVDAAVTALNSGTYTGNLVPKPTYSLDGESYAWGEYQEILTRQLAALNDLIQRESLPFRIRSYARP
jgi:hypothetical protein